MPRPRRARNDLRYWLWLAWQYRPVLTTRARIDDAVTLALVQGRRAVRAEQQRRQRWMDEAAYRAVAEAIREAQARPRLRLITGDAR